MKPLPVYQRCTTRLLGWERRVDHGSARKLALSGATAGHAGRWARERELAAHISAGSLKVREDLTRIMGDHFLRRTPKIPAAPAPAIGPTDPQRPEVLNRRL